LGIDFSDAEVVEAVAEKVQIQAPAGLPEMFRADDLRVTLRLPEIKNELGERSSGGDYVIGSASAERLHGRWYLSKLRWVSMPSMTDDAVVKSIELENYVTKFHRLPHGTAAPDIELSSLSPDGQRSSKLSDYRGKFVILEWWATWCGPCQEPMAKLQKIREEHPEWADQVEIITVSLDDPRATAYKHLQTRGWTNTANFWAGGGFSSPAAKAFRVSAIPEVHLISTNGTVVDSDLRLSPFLELDAILKGGR
jgi:thiol-disulfide isomerase/thioredoxin